MNYSNKDKTSSAESGEGRPLIKENAGQPSTHPTQSGERVSQGLAGMRKAARENKEMRFTALLHQLTVDLLRVSFYSLRRKAAPGVDGVTWYEYEAGLEERLIDLHGRVHRGAYRAVMRWLIHPGPSTPRAFLSLWLTFWLLAEAWGIYWWLWSAFGKEIVTIKEGSLGIKRDILGYGRTRTFPVGSVTNLRASGFFPSNSYWDNYLVQLKLAGGTVGFDTQGQVKKFGIQLSEPEAQEVVRELKPCLPS
jgi:hypothetical protein